MARCESALINQFLRSGTSIGVNIREAFYAHGKADFIAKLQIALKECYETEYWIELILESGYYHDKTLLRCKTYFLNNPPKPEDERYAYDIIQKAYWINGKKIEKFDYKKKTNLLENYYKTFAKGEQI